MPNYPVRDSAIQVSQSITRAASLQNSGTSPIYLSNEAGVGAYNAGLTLSPGGTANWPAETDLWAICADGEQSMLAVLYGASGATVASVTVNGPVTATIDGPVTVTGDVDATIVGPVTVTGAVDATVTGPVTANVSGPVTVNGAVDIGNVVSTEVTNSITAEVTNTVTAEIANIVNVAGEVNATVTGDVDATIVGPVTVTGAVDATVTGPVTATVSGPVTVNGAVDIGNVVSTEVTNSITAEVTNTVTAEIANIVNVAGEVNATVTGDVDATIVGPVTVTGAVDATVIGPVTANVSGPVTVSSISAPVNVTGTVDANITGPVNATITGPVNATVNGEVNIGGVLTPVETIGYTRDVYNATVAVPAVGTSRIINIPDHEVGLSYTVTLESLIPGATSAVIGLMLEVDGIWRYQTSIRDNGAGFASLASDGYHRFTVPYTAKITRVMLASNGGARDVYLRIAASSNPVTQAITDVTFPLAVKQEVNTVAGASALTTLIPPSYQGWTVQCFSAAGANVSDARIWCDTFFGSYAVRAIGWKPASIALPAGSQAINFSIPPTPFATYIELPAPSTAVALYSILKDHS